MADNDSGGKSLQDVMSGDLFANSTGELVSVLNFMEKHGTPLSPNQLQGIALLRYLQTKRKNKAFDPILTTITTMSKNLTFPSTFIEVINAYFTGQFIDKRMMNNALKGGAK
jgi:hypothetical protein